MFANLIQFVYTGYYSNYSRIFQEYYCEETTCTRTTDMRFLVTGIPVGVSDFLNEEITDDDIWNWSYGCFQSTWSERRMLRRDDHMPMTNRESDIALAVCRSSAEIDVLVYQLADKYGVPTLQRYALSRLRKSLHPSPNPCAVSGFSPPTVLAAMKQVVPDYTMADTELKKALAYGTAQHCATVTGVGSDEASTVREWLRSDDELCFMVMDVLAGVVSYNHTNQNCMN